MAVSASGDCSSFIASLTATLSDNVDLKAFGVWLKDPAGLRGGGKKGTLQGGRPKVTLEFGDIIKKWLLKNVS